MGATSSRTLTEKQERFARAYVETGNACEAYRQAYAPGRMSENAIKVEACRLLQNPNVALTLEQLRAEHRVRHDITVDSLTAMLMEEREVAHKAKRPAVDAVMGIAKLHGLLVDKSKAEVDVGVREQARRDAEEFTRGIEQLAARLRERGEAGETEH